MRVLFNVRLRDITDLVCSVISDPVIVALVVGIIVLLAIIIPGFVRNRRFSRNRFRKD